MLMVKAWLVIESRELTLAEISDVMERQPDQGHDRGSLAPVRKVPRERTSWSAELTWPRDTHGGTEGLTTAIESLGQPMAERAGKLASRGCEIVVSVHQELADTPESLGLYLTPAAIRWLADAGAAVSVDQYIDSEAEAT